MVAFLTVGRRYYNPPINGDEWIPPELLEAGADDRRRAAGLAAGAEVRQQKVSLERDMVSRLVTRLEQTKRELQLAIVGASDFRRFQINALIADIDRSLATAKADLLRTARATYDTAAELGDASAASAVRAAQLDVSTVAGVSPTLIQHAYDNTAELLTEPMQQFRSRIIQDVRRMALNTESFGDKMVGLAREIDAAGFDTAQYKAERILRTEVGRTFNGANFERMLDLSRRAPFLRKIWIRTNDGRTRETHVQAAALYQRGKGIRVAELFKVGAATLRYPIDPLVEPAGKIGARETIMCRCNAATDFDVAELAAATKARVQVAIGQPPPPPEPPPPPTITPAKVKVARVKKPKTVDELATAARKKLGKIHTKYDARQTELETALVSSRTNLINARRDLEMQTIMANDQAAIDRLRADKQRLEAEFIRVTKALETLQADRVKEMRRALYVDKPNQYGKGQLRYQFTNPRLVGTGWSPTTGKALNAKEMRRRIDGVVRELEKLFSRQTEYIVEINVRMITDDRGIPDILGRAFARQADNSINLALAERERVIAHEIGHVLEYNDPQIRRKVRDFYARRTAGETPKKLSELTGNADYRDHEVARPDKFLSPYMGKEYSGPFTEIVSMGVEYFYADPLALATQDPEYFDFIFKLLRGQ